MPRSIRRAAAPGRLLFHAPCFDGIASAVLTHDFLSSHAGWSEIALKGVGYKESRSWLRQRLGPRTAIVDFLYHPQAVFWADHHATPFLDEQTEKDFGARAKDACLAYDAAAPSCAVLIQRHLQRVFNYRNHRFDALVTWATKIDSADYGSPAEALSADIPAIRLNLSLAVSGPAGYPERLVRWLLEDDLDAVSRRPSVSKRVLRATRQFRAGLDRIGKAAVIRDGIVVFDVNGSSAQVPRYGPYHFFPEARYSVGLVRRGREAKVTAMRNPWRQFESVPLGGVLARHGGGGHHRVASVLLTGNRAQKASMVLQDVVAEIQGGSKRGRPKG